MADDSFKYGYEIIFAWILSSRILKEKTEAWSFVIFSLNHGNMLKPSI